MAAVRGLTWQDKEMLELLAIWEDLKIQEKLSHNTRNIEIFRKIPKGLAAKGIIRTADQCHSKTKDLRMKFKEAMANNEKLGTSFQKCPYFNELSRILHGRVSVTGRRLSHSFAEGTAPGTSQQSISASLAEEEESNTLGTSTSTQTVACGSPATTNPTDFPPAVIMSELLPKSHLAYIRARTKRVLAVQKVGEKMLEQAAWSRWRLPERNT
ncbi:UNVERIFIED_CONTAM: hypothetical protein K2H54_048679 [Gekko kuhli]